jgi:hemerythrin superfamily protein
MASELIEELKEEHSELVGKLIEAKDLCVRSLAGQEKLLEVKKMLIAHLEKENRFLYPTLVEASREDENLRKALDVTYKEIKEFMEVARDFFEKYSKGCEEMKFIVDYGMFFIMMRDMISREEDTLFSEYEKILRGQ